VVRPRRAYDYHQTLIGDCGHAVEVWPQITDIGGGNPVYLCTECTRAAYAIPESEPLSVWVREKPEPKPRKVTPKKPKPPRKLSPLEQMQLEAGLF
jgi:hypothetical protein